MAKRDILRLPVLSAGAEYVVMGHLMRRNILAYKAPTHYEGYDLICIHPEPRHKATGNEVDKVLVQGKSRYATDCDRGFPIKYTSIDAFHFLIVAFLNVGKFNGKNDGLSGSQEPEFFTLPSDFVREHHNSNYSWEKVLLKNLAKEIEPFKNELGFELIAEKLGIPRPTKQRGLATESEIDDEE